MMNEPNYECIGRCMVLEQRIHHHLETLRNLKHEITYSPSPNLIGGTLELTDSAAFLIEDAASKYRNLLNEITSLTREYNEHAPSAGVKVICIRIIGS